MADELEVLQGVIDLIKGVQATQTLQLALITELTKRVKELEDKLECPM